jgi:DNA relaxase NicK
MADTNYLKDTITERCHWLAYSVPAYKDQLWPSFISASGKEIRPIQHYTDGLEMSNGARVFWNINRPSIGKHVIFSGQCCDIIGEKLKECLSFVHLQGYKTTRLDLAIDVFNTNLSLSHMESLILRRELKTHAQVAPNIRDLLGTGKTVQLGKAGSGAFLRVYDKAAEQKTSGSWIRIEISYGARKAKSALETYLQHEDIAGMVQDFVKFPKWRKWNKILSSTPIPVRYAKSETNTRKWLMSSVAKSIAKEMLFDDGQEFRTLLLQQIDLEYKILTEENVLVDW